jgi:hypothetical protein
MLPTQKTISSQAVSASGASFFPRMIAIGAAESPTRMLKATWRRSPGDWTIIRSLPDCSAFAVPPLQTSASYSKPIGVGGRNRSPNSSAIGPWLYGALSTGISSWRETMRERNRCSTRHDPAPSCGQPIWRRSSRMGRRRSWIESMPRDTSPAFRRNPLPLCRHLGGSAGSVCSL